MKRLLIYILLISITSACDEFLEISPSTTELDTTLVFENDNTAITALEAIYHELQFDGFASGNTSSITFLSNLLADDAIEYGTVSSRQEFYANDVLANNTTNNNIWSSAYSIIYRINALLEGVTNNLNLSEEIKQRIQGEGKFVRAFTYYYLVHLYGEIPLVLTTNYKENQSLSQNSIEDIYTQIEQDLKESIDLLPKDYRYAEGKAIRPTQYSAHTLLARMALYAKEYDKAIAYASNIIDSKNYQLENLDNVFLAGSKEAIWQLLPGNPNTGANEGYYYIMENNPQIIGATASTALTEDLLKVWETGDLRQTHWINIYMEGDRSYYYPFKYKIKTGGDTEEYSMVMRLAEVYLIRAEAHAMQGEVTKALTDLNIIRNRAGLPDLMVNDITDIQDNVLEERRRELFSEWGHRWLDLKRFGKLDEVLGNKKTDWSENAKLLPIPEQDILRNPFLTQNPGY